MKTRVGELQAKFVGAQLAEELADPVGYTADPVALAAFRLLVHAEIEEYLEAKAREGINSIRASFAAGARSVRDNLSVVVIARLLDVQLRFDPTNWETDVASVLRAAEDKCNDNNGIKEGSFTLLAVFSGKMPDEVDAALASSLSSYGKERGSVAHRSVARVTTIQAPSEEARAANDLMSGLEAFFN